VEVACLACVLTLGALVVLKSLEGGERSTTGNQLMAEAALVGLLVGVDLVVSVVRFTLSSH